WFAHPLLILVAGLFAFPLFWMVASSLKLPEELATHPYRLWPEQVAFGNYQDAIGAMPFWRYLLNTVVLCAGSVCGTVLSSALVAYGLAKVRWPLRQVVFAIVLATMLLPWHATMIPRFLLLRELGLYNSLAALIVPTFLGDAFSIFLLRQFFLTLPDELSEAARLDGLSDWGIFWKIVLPLSKPALIAVGLFQLIAVWNDFGGPLLYLSDPQKFPLAYGLERFVSAYSDQTHLLLAAATLFTLPILLVFLLTQRFFVEGVKLTGMK
ncbi:MAG: carbohydrate ABC transporter permease, partial [Planctomycetota bacterium]